MPLHIRPELPTDLPAIRAINTAAFPTPAEADLVDCLRASGDAVLSLLAFEGDTPVGHLLLSRATVIPGDDPDEQPFPALALAPMAVIPSVQRRGVGSALVRRAIEDARAAAHHLIIVLGHPAYYPRFGFTPASRSGIRPPFDAPDEAFMGLWLSQPRPLRGTLRYAPAFDSLDP